MKGMCKQEISMYFLAITQGSNDLLPVYQHNAGFPGIYQTWPDKIVPGGSQNRREATWSAFSTKIIHQGRSEYLRVYCFKVDRLADLWSTVLISKIPLENMILRGTEEDYQQGKYG